MNEFARRFIRLPLERSMWAWEYNIKVNQK